jgi:hypothetical protein
MCSPFDLAHPASANPNIARTLWLESLQQLSGKSIQGLFRSGSSSETRPPPLAVPMHAQIQWRAEPAGYSGLVAQHTCSVGYGNQRGCDIAPTADRDADPHALASSLHWLCHHSHSSCVAVGERHNADITQRARGTPDRVPWCRDGDGPCGANNAAACCAVPFS